MKLSKPLVMGVVGGTAIVIASIVFVAFGAKERKATQKEIERKMSHNESPKPVELEKVKVEEKVRQRNFPGVVKASEKTSLSFRVSGPLIEANIILGQSVKKGDLLMQIDPRDFEDQIMALEAQLAGAQAQQKNAKSDYDRVSDLFEENVAPQSDYDHARAAMDSAEASVKALTAKLKIAKHALADTSLIAPYDGTVSKQMVENYEMIKAGVVVLQYQNVQSLEVTINVPENEMITRKNRMGINAEVSFPAAPGKSYPAKLKEWSTVADSLTRTYALTFEFSAPEDLTVIPGMSASITVNDDVSGEEVLTIPVSALCPGDDEKSTVWIYDMENETAEQRNVVCGSLVGMSRIAISEGISEGEQVIVSGSRLINSSTPLKLAQK